MTELNILEEPLGDYSNVRAGLFRVCSMCVYTTPFVVAVIPWRLLCLLLSIRCQSGGVCLLASHTIMPYTLAGASGGLHRGLQQGGHLLHQAGDRSQDIVRLSL